MQEQAPEAEKLSFAKVAKNDSNGKIKEKLFENKE